MTFFCRRRRRGLLKLSTLEGVDLVVVVVALIVAKLVAAVFSTLAEVTVTIMIIMLFTLICDN